MGEKRKNKGEERKSKIIRVKQSNNEGRSGIGDGRRGRGMKQGERSDER